MRNLPLGMLRVDHIIAVSQCGHRSVISCWYVHRVYSYVQLGLSPFCQPNNLQSKYTWTNWCLYKCRGQKYVRSRAIKAAVIWFIVPHIPPLPSPPKMIINKLGLSCAKLRLRLRWACMLRLIDNKYLYWEFGQWSWSSLFHWSCPTIVSSLGLLVSRFSTTSPDGGCAGYVVVVAQDMWWAGAGGNKIKANSAQLSWAGAWAELGNICALVALTMIVSLALSLSRRRKYFYLSSILFSSSFSSRKTRMLPSSAQAPAQLSWAELALISFPPAPGRPAGIIVK